MPWWQEDALFAAVSQSGVACDVESVHMLLWLVDSRGQDTMARRDEPRMFAADKCVVRKADGWN